MYIFSTGNIIRYDISAKLNILDEIRLVFGPHVLFLFSFSVLNSNKE